MTEAAFDNLTYTVYYDVESRPARGVAPAEDALTLYINGQPWVSLMCTPTQLEELALGFLFNESLIEGMDDVAVVKLCGGEHCVDVWLNRDIALPQARVITSGCSGGAVFEDVARSRPRVEWDGRIAPQRVTALMEALESAAALYQRTGGVHTSAMAGIEEGELLCIAEDIGRHNTLDKIAGACLRRGERMQGRALLTSGRVSSEMVGKAARMGTPVVISRTSPTALSVQLARTWNITLIGYTRRRSFRVYAGEERLSSE